MTKIELLEMLTKQARKFRADADPNQTPSSASSAPTCSASYFSSFGASNEGGSGGACGIDHTGSTLLDIDPRDSKTISLRSCGGDDSGLSLSDMKDRLWELMVKSDINVRYWKYYETRVIWIEKFSRVALILSAVVSLLAWALEPEYLPWATAMSALSAFVVLAIVPVFGLEGYGAKVQGIKSKWVEIRDDYQQLWTERVDMEKPTWKKRLSAVQKRDQELEQGDLWTPDSVKLRTMAQQDCEKLFVPNFFQAL